FVTRYGREEVATWWWESPNEGQLKWNAAGVGYWDAVTAGLADVDKRFAQRFGGPAAIYRKNPYDFVKLLESTPNIFTGKKEHIVGFVSGHIKKPATEMVDSEIAVIKKINAAYPGYKDVPFVNTEHDPWNGWGKRHDWAGGPRFASWMANAVYQEQLRIIEQLGQPYFCSNDNGFLGETWKQRTQMVLFKKGHRFALIKKPAHTVFTMLAKMGSVRLPTEGLPDVRSGVGALATRNTEANGQIAVMACNDGRPNTRLTVKLKDLPKRQWVLSRLRIDANTSNPIRVWGKDDVPPKEVLPRLREEMELAYAEPCKKVSSESGTLELELELPRHSVSLLLLTPKPDKPPKAAGPIRVDVFPGLYESEHLLTWKGSNSYALHTYEVLHADTIDGEYQRLNKADLLCTAWTGSARKAGYYRIRAVDAWGQKSESEPIRVDRATSSAPGDRPAARP
ncbi:MAG: GH39 family glycosyl hydrolase, partial [Phycisphaerae bacterium]